MKVVAVGLKHPTEDRITGLRVSNTNYIWIDVQVRLTDASLFKATTGYFYPFLCSKLLTSVAIAKVMTLAAN